MAKRTSRPDARPAGATSRQRRDARAQRASCGRRAARRCAGCSTRGCAVFAERGFHAARVDDIVRAARTSHGTFYLYFTNKEDLLRALATECGLEMGALAETLGPVGARRRRLRRAARVPRTVLRDLPALRPGDPGVDGGTRRGSRRCRLWACARSPTSPPRSARGCGRPGVASDAASVSALMALLERFAYFLVSRRLDFDTDAMLDTVTHIVHRGFFARPARGCRRPAAGVTAAGARSGAPSSAPATSSSGERSREVDRLASRRAAGSRAGRRRRRPRRRRRARRPSSPAA